MAYIGSLPNLEIFAANVRDDIVPDGLATTFDLSQEVPGGYEGNIVVVCRKFLYENLLQNSNHVNFNNSGGSISTLTSSDSLTSVELSRLVVGQAVRVSGFSNVYNNGTFLISNISYSDPNITITFNQVGIPGTTEVGVSISVDKAYDGSWEVLEPEIDYTIGGVGANYNKQITFSNYVLQVADMCYVVHKGEATYNMVPSAKSVGPEQLQDNLRNFVVDRFLGTGSQQDFTLSQTPVNSHAILVTVDNVVKDGDDPSVSYTGGDWTLTDDLLHFKVAPLVSTKIKVLHLSFSTVSRRVSLAQGQIASIPPNSISSTELADGSVSNSKLQDNSLSTNKYQNNSVNGSKIQLGNNDPLYGLKTDLSTEQSLIKIGSDNNTYVDCVSGQTINFSIGGTSKVKLSTSSVTPAVTNSIDLGSSSFKYKDAYFAGNITVAGTVDGSDITTINSDVNTIKSVLGNSVSSNYLVPPGAIVKFAGSSLPAGWLYCRGQTISRATYSLLFAALGITYGSGDGLYTFNLPDLRERFVLGKTDSTVNIPNSGTLGGLGGTANHTHDITHAHNISASGNLIDHYHDRGTLYFLGSEIEHHHDLSYHYHNLNNHTHTVPKHYHTAFSISAGAHVHDFRYADGTGGSSPTDDYVQIVSINNNKFSTNTITVRSNTHNHTRAYSAVYTDYVGYQGTGRYDNDNPSSTTLTGTNIDNTSAVVGSTYTKTSKIDCTGVGLTGPNLNAGQNWESGNSTTTKRNLSDGDISNPSRTGSLCAADGTSTTYNQTVTGATTSQSTTSSGTNNPPYIVLDYIIKT